MAFKSKEGACPEQDCLNNYKHCACDGADPMDAPAHKQVASKTKTVRKALLPVSKQCRAFDVSKVKMPG